jgi:hypothetical protein
VVPPEGTRLLSADADQQAQHHVRVKARALRRGQQGFRLLQREALRWPPGAALRRFHQGRDVRSDEIVSLGVPDRPLQREPGDLQRPGGIAIRQLAEPGPDITRAQVAQRPGAYRIKQRPQQTLVEGARPLGRAVQALAQPVLHSLAHRIGLRGLDASFHFLVERLEPVADFLLGLAKDLAPDPLAVGTIAERHRSHVPVLRRSEVDRVLAAWAAADFRLGHGGSLTLRLPTTLPDEALDL